jgi:hypothetical protein
MAPRGVCVIDIIDEEDPIYRSRASWRLATPVLDSENDSPLIVRYCARFSARDARDIPKRSFPAFSFFSSLFLDGPTAMFYLFRVKAAVSSARGRARG